MDIDTVARQLEGRLADLVAACRAAPGVAGGATWSPTEILAHVAEFMPYWAAQAVQVAARERDGEPFGRTHDDPARIAAVDAHADDPLDEAAARAVGGTRDSIAILRRIPTDAWARTAVHARRGEMTVAQIVEQFIVHHMDEHATQALEAAAS